MTFNEFTKELRKRNIDAHNAYMFGLMYERMMHMAQEIDMMSKVMLQITQSFEGFVELRDMDANLIAQLRKRGQVDGVDVHSESVSDDPDKM